MGSEQSRFWLGKLKEAHITKPDLHGLCRHLELNSKLPGQAAADVLRFSLEALALVVDFLVDVFRAMIGTEFNFPLLEY